MLRFGTDGVRGVANRDLTPELAVALGRAAARVLGGDAVVVGRDTRLSGPMLQAALSAGIAGEGADVVDLGVAPTPAVAFVAARRSLAGAVVSASHNPFPDNGIKLFAAGGRKLDDVTERSIEQEVGRARERRSGAELGRFRRDAGWEDDYVAHLAAGLGGRSLEGLRVVIDCAHGAAFEVAPAALRAAGAGVSTIGTAPDGTNINAGCGSTHPEELQRAVVESGADAGLALDGDADRVLAVDGRGELVDGDRIIALCALDLKARGRLRDDTVVVTVMANLGFRHAMAEAGIRVEETAVGDRYVLEALERGGWSLGGEQSGHVIFTDAATTGDGVLTGLRLLDVVARAGRPLADLAGEVMTRHPQVLRNVALRNRPADLQSRLQPATEAAAAALGDAGRVVVRPSGTEPVVRVMVEAVEESLAATTADRLVADVEAACR